MSTWCGNEPVCLGLCEDPPCASLASILSMRSLEFHLEISLGKTSSLSDRSSGETGEHSGSTSCYTCSPPEQENTRGHLHVLCILLQSHRWTQPASCSDKPSHWSLGLHSTKHQPSDLRWYCYPLHEEPCRLQLSLKRWIVAPFAGTSCRITSLPPTHRLPLMAIVLRCVSFSRFQDRP